MRIFLAVLAVAVLGAAGFAIHVRTAQDDPALWHVDPLAGPFSGSPNEFVASPDPVAGLDAGRQMRAPVLRADASRLAAAFEAVALAAPRTERIAGSPEERHMTYVQRSELMRFPDYVSVEVLTVEGGATLAVYSRSRYGYSDMGVNEARVRAWLDAVGREIAD